MEIVSKKAFIAIKECVMCKVKYYLLEEEAVVEEDKLRSPKKI